jgi:DNA-binding MurR/RpiR family transcriptional regulator
MYRQRIQRSYATLSPSHGKIADFVMSRYYEVALMDATQLAERVGVHISTVVYFVQHLGYRGFPDFLHEIRRQVRAETYAFAADPELPAANPAARFQHQVEQDRHNLRRIQIHNAPHHLQAVAAFCQNARRYLLVADGYASPLAEVTAAQLRHQHLDARAVADHPLRCAESLAWLEPSDLVIGLTLAEEGETVARVLTFARQRGCRTLGIVGSLASPVTHSAEKVLFTPSETPGSLPSLAALASTLAALAWILAGDG